MGLFDGLLSAGAGVWSAGQARNQSEHDATMANLANASEAKLNREFQYGTMHESMDFNSAESAKNRSFQEEMSGSSYQRAIEDMKAAGLNPMLAYGQGGASSPSGSAASVSGPSGTPTHPAQTPQVFQKLNALATAAQIRNVEADTRNKEVETDEIRARTGGHVASAAESVSRKAKLDEEIPEARARISLLLEQAGKAKDEAAESRQRERVNRVEEELKFSQIELTRTQEKLAKGHINLAQAEEVVKRIQAVIEGSYTPRAENRERYDSSSVGKATDWWRRALGGSLGFGPGIKDKD